MKKCWVALLAVTGISTLWNGPVQAADINWGPPTFTSGLALDVYPYGTPVEASYNNPSPGSVTVNGVSFAVQGPGIVYTNFREVNNTSHAYTPGTWWSPDPGMVALVGGSAWQRYDGTPQTATSLTLNNLIAGRSYTVQIFMPAWDYNWYTRFTGGANTSDWVHPSGSSGSVSGTTNPTPQYILGGFIADGSSQLIGVSGTDWGDLRGYVNVAAVQVLEGTYPPVPFPEPATWAMFLLGIGVVGGYLRVARRGR